MITKDQVPRIVGHPAYDASHNKIGDVGQVYLDTTSGEPEWMSIRTGLFGTRETFVPLGPAELEGDEVIVPFGADKVRHAPRVTTEGGHLPASEEARLYDYYGLQYRPYGQREQAGEATATTAGPDGGRTGLAEPAAAGRTGFREETRPSEAGYESEAGYDSEEELRRQGALGDRDTLRREGAFGDREALRREGTLGEEATGRGTEEAMTRSEERLLVGTEWREAGRAKLRKYVVTEEQQQTIPVREERVRVVHEPVAEDEREGLGSEIGEKEQEVVLRAERPVVETETVPVERVRLAKETVTHDETVGRQVRKERIEVEGVSEDEER